MQQIVFYILALLAIVFSVATITTRNAMFSVLSLVATFFALAGFYLMLNAEFVAFVHIIVYAGAIMVLFLFVVMMLNLNQSPVSIPRPLLARLAAVVAGGIFGLTLVAALSQTSLPTSTESTALAEVGSVRTLGKMLFNEFLLPFELTSILFIATMVGVVVLTKKEE
jgi:NADH-quinone oxidoreductase subunit J